MSFKISVVIHSFFASMSGGPMSWACISVIIFFILSQVPSISICFKFCISFSFRSNLELICTHTYGFYSFLVSIFFDDFVFLIFNRRHIRNFMATDLWSLLMSTPEYVFTVCTYIFKPVPIRMKSNWFLIIFLLVSARDFQVYNRLECRLKNA